MISINQKPSFRRVYKKLHLQEKKVVDEAIRAIQKDPSIGEVKKGDLAGLSVYKFKSNKQEKLLAYFHDETQLLLINLGSHENFYRDLKK